MLNALDLGHSCSFRLKSDHKAPLGRGLRGSLHPTIRVFVRLRLRGFTPSQFDMWFPIQESLDSWKELL